MELKPTQSRQHPSEILRRRDLSRHSGPGYGVPKGKAGRMEGLPRQAPRHICRMIKGRTLAMSLDPAMPAIDRIPDQRVSDMSQMEPNLMCSTGFKLAPDKCRRWPWVRAAYLPPGLQRGVMGDGASALTIINHCHFLSIMRASGDVPLNRPCAWPRRAPGQRQIRSFNVMVREQGGQAPMSDLRFSHSQNTCGVLIQTMHNAGSLNSANPRQITPAVVQQGIDQCPGPAPRSRVHRHTRHFIHKEQVLIFEQDIEGNIFGLRNSGEGFRRTDPIALTSTNAAPRVFSGNDESPGHRLNRTRLDQCLKTRPRKLRNSLRQKPIKAQPIVPAFHVCDIVCHNDSIDLFYPRRHARRRQNRQSRIMS